MTLRRTLAALAAATAFLAGQLPGAAQAEAEPPEVQRLAGGDRFGTAAAVSAATFHPGVPVAYVATGLNFADALAGGPAAGFEGGPILLVTKNGVPAATAEELARLAPGRIVVLGGSAAVSEAVAAELATYAPGGVQRRAGGDRYATAAAVSAAVFAPGVPLVLVATGLNFPDALAGGAAGAATGTPLLLVGSDTVPPATAQELSRLRPGAITILGGQESVSAAVETQLQSYTAGAVARAAGTDRYATAVELSTATFAAPQDTVFIATGEHFPDALAGAPAAGPSPGPLLLVPGECIPGNVQGEINRLDPARLVILGGTAAVGPGVAEGELCAPAPAANPLPLGAVSDTGDVDPSCPAGATCSAFQVSCPGVEQAARGFLAVAAPGASARGLAVFFSGESGDTWWAEGDGIAAQMLAELQSDGFHVVQVRWEDPWLAAPAGEPVGPRLLACRPATVIRYLYDSLYRPLGVTAPEPGGCGFCVSGNSGGASQVSYALSHYGLDEIIDAAVPTSGPPHAALAKGCLDSAGQEAYWYSSTEAEQIDASYGVQAGLGPCERHDAELVQQWQQDAVDVAGYRYAYPTTRVHFIFGGEDDSSAVAHGQDYRDKLVAAGSPMVGLSVVAAMDHTIQNSQEGLGALRRALTE